MAATWLVAVVMAIAIRMVFGATFVSTTEGLGWLMVASVPAVVVLSVFRGVPRTMAPLPYYPDQLARTRRATNSSSN